MTQTRTRRTKTRKMRIGSKAALGVLICVFAAQAGSKKKVVEPYAVVGGTVFREPGLAFPEAQVTLIPDPEAGQPPSTVKKLTAVSDRRGEFAFRVPVTAMRYTVRAVAKGYTAQEKSVSVEGEERVDATLTLKPESK